jgi:prepilin-type N-terminal cleavage/methylation domain-containing protein
MKRAEPARRLRTQQALTLLEVMAAVALLGIVYAYLARAASQGIITAGQSRWRLEASLLADEAMAQVEQEIRDGVGLPLGEEEIDADPFVITRAIEFYALPEELFPRPESAAASLLHPGDTDLGVLRLVRISVRWSDGVRMQRLHRITFGYDTEAAAPQLGLLETLAGVPEDGT